MENSSARKPSLIWMALAASLTLTVPALSFGAPPAAAEPLCPRNRAPFLYKVSYGSSTSYLLGTIHAGLPLSEMGPSPERALRMSRSVLVEWRFDRGEVDLFFTDPLAFSVQFREKMGVRNTTRRPPSAASFEKLIALGMPPALRPRVNDGMCFLASFTQYTFPKPRSADFEVVKYAHDNGLNITQLDNPALAAEIVASDDGPACSLDEELASVDPTQQKRSEQELVEAVRCGDTSIQSGEATYITKRNRAWMPALVAQFRAGQAFAAVGAAHLTGSASLLKLLREQGFRVEKLE